MIDFRPCAVAFADVEHSLSHECRLRDTVAIDIDAEVSAVAGFALPLVGGHRPVLQGCYSTDEGRGSDNGVFQLSGFAT